MRILKLIPTKVALVLLMLLVAAVVYGGWRISQRASIFGPPGGRGSQAQGDREFETDLMESFADELNEADDLDRDERDAAHDILKEADAVWRRVKLENNDAIQRANRRPRIVPPNQ